ncbi:MAG: D-glycero-beta-D-manno-heptose 1-phosphate adenylyltransferase [Candidatus Paceibacterota bacterium]|jgi:rfaE bifunctional protein nucleotidyltransferase chain/domain
MYEKKIVTLETLLDRRCLLQQAQKKVVFTNGCFDILHVGHSRYLQAARDLGDMLIVGVNTDQSVRKLKGPTRPINLERDRAEVLASLGCVDYVVLFDEHTPEALISKLQPDIHVKGGDYTEERLPEAKIVREYGGSVVIIPLTPDRSTTRTLEKIHSCKNRAN